MFSQLRKASILVILLWAQGVTFGQESALDRILAANNLRVCIWPDYYGISYRDPKNLQLSGIDVDMAKGLAKDLGVGLTFIDSSFARLIDDMTQDRCDIAMFAIGVTPSRKAHLRFTTPHLASDIYAITTKSNRRIKHWSDIDQPSTVVAVAKGTLHEPVMRERLKQAALRVLDTPHAREQEVESGRADVFMTDFPYSQRMLKTTDWARLIQPDGTYHVTPYAWAIRPGDERWYQRLETFLQKVRHDGSLQASAVRHGLKSILTP